MDEDSRKPGRLIPTAGKNHPTSGSKPIYQIRQEIKFKKLNYGIQLLILLIILFFLLGLEFFPYWFNIIKEYFS